MRELPMDFLKIAAERRSVRRYRDEDVPAGLLDQVLEAVRWAPSGGNIQPWEVIVVRDPETRKALQETLGGYNPARKAVLNAPVLLVLCGQVKIPDAYRKDKEVVTKFGDWWFMFHLGCAAQNLALAAHALGLGSVMVGFFDHDKAKEILSVPEAYEVVLMIPLGYPAATPKPPPRRERYEFCHLENFSSTRSDHRSS
jgi:nitroreductase